MTRATADQADVDAAGGLAELERLYVEHGDYVWRAAASMGVADHELEDVVQDAFVVVHRRLEDYEGRGAITSWLYGIVRGLVANRRRREGCRQRHLRALAPEPAGDDPEAASAFKRFIDSLDPRLRGAFTLSEVEGMSGPEVAQALALNVNTVYTRLRAARRAFTAFARAELGRTQDGGSQ